LVVAVYLGAAALFGGGDQEWIADVVNDTRSPVTLVPACELPCSPGEQTDPIAHVPTGGSVEVPACRNGAECDGVRVTSSDGSVVGCLAMTFATTPRSSVVRVSSARPACVSPEALATGRSSK
jgi:hypothetical protein